MCDNMALHGYGVRMEDLTPFVDLEKLCGFFENETGTALTSSGCKGYSLNYILSDIDDIVCDSGRFAEIADILVHEGMPTTFEFLFSERAEAFLYLPSRLPWERADSTPETMEETQAIIYKTLRPFLKDDTTPDDVAALCDHIYDIS